MSNTLPPLRRTSENRAQWAKVLIYCAARWGKTNLARTVPGGPSKALILATEIGDTGGLQTLGDVPCGMIKITDLTEMGLVLSELERRQVPPSRATLDGPAGVYYGGEHFTTVINDSYTATVDGPIYDAALSNQGWNSVWEKADRKDPRQFYPYLNEKGRQVAKSLMALEAHVVFLCREGLVEEGEGRERRVWHAPELPGQKLPRELPGWPDATLHGVWVNGQRALWTREHYKSVSGFRVPPNFAVPDKIVPNLDLIFRLTLGDSTVCREIAFTPNRQEAPQTQLPSLETTFRR